MLESRIVTDLTPVCPAGYAVAETAAGSGVLCRITGRIVATGTDPGSLRAFCCNAIPSAIAADVNGQIVNHGYQACPVWAHNRQIELEGKADLPEDTPDRVREGLKPAFITRA